MTDFKDLVQLRRSHRKFTTEEMNPDDLKMILRAALMSPTSKSQRAWQFIVVDDPVAIEKLARTPGHRGTGRPRAERLLGGGWLHRCHLHAVPG